jgi:hypothetical protein
MALPASGPLAFTNIQTEFGGTNPIGLNEYYRGGAYVPVSSSTTTIPSSGTIAANNFYGTSKRIDIPLSIGSPTYNYDVYNNRGPGYVAGISDVEVTVSPGVLVGSTSTGAYAMLVPSSFSPGDTVTIVNNGVIQGMGGNGATAPFGAAPGGGGGGGGNALYVNRPTTIQNNAVIAGGGGGGGAGGGYTPNKGPSDWGGSGGGGAGYNAGSGGGGGYPGSPGSSSSGGGGGGGLAPGGPGGGRGAAGSGGSPIGGANPRPGGPGGNAGSYIVGNPFVTWTATGTRQGPAS